MADWSRNLLAMLIGAQQGKQQRQVGQTEQFQQMLQNQLQQQQFGLQQQKFGLQERAFDTEQARLNEALGRDERFRGEFGQLLASPGWQEKDPQSRIDAILNLAGNYPEQLDAITTFTKALRGPQAGQGAVSRWVSTPHGIYSNLIGPESFKTWQQMDIDPVQDDFAKLTEKLATSMVNFGEAATFQEAIPSAQGLAREILQTQTQPTPPGAAPPGPSIPPPQEFDRSLFQEQSAAQGFPPPPFAISTLPTPTGQFLPETPAAMAATDTNALLKLLSMEEEAKRELQRFPATDDEIKKLRREYLKTFSGD